MRCTYRWIVEGDRVLGGIALRHGFDDFVPRLGHVGYGIRPSARRRGLGGRERNVGEDGRAARRCPRRSGSAAENEVRADR
ncbi:hypothetical protein [Amycolatopsis sp. H20-H5]|uniref:hypothetical protein n=1 Tax=Amycolatopsis sp. H20-H5 TaxID=3046309 RepID=UPI002DB5D9F9|nr:hypothetical protein [Amycolatopsis sp. H20-H5]MEC3973871.1 hypothetical protein [Amycolatopsis sp. H20-H5]